LCTSLGEKITEIENEAAEIKKINSERLDRKGKLVIDRNNINSELRTLKVKVMIAVQFAFKFSNSNFLYSIEKKRR
jgi:hypothetical protein